MAHSVEMWNRKIEDGQELLIAVFATAAGQNMVMSDFLKLPQKRKKRR